MYLASTSRKQFFDARLGVKGLLTYVEARDQRVRALPLVAAADFCGAAFVLSRFRDSIPKRGKAGD